jgi:ABC-2 type transport system ATP-binding protein
MKRRINLGCALMHKPRLLLLDEPTVGIDPQARQNILEFIKGLCAEGTGLLYTTHYLEEAEELCDRIGIIDHGKLLAEGTLNDLQNRLGGDKLFIVEGKLGGAKPSEWPDFQNQFKVIQQTDKQIIAASITDRHASDCLKDLLALNLDIENVTLKRPSLNDVFLQLTGRELRE